MYNKFILLLFYVGEKGGNLDHKCCKPDLNTYFPHEHHGSICTKPQPQIRHSHFELLVVVSQIFLTIYVCLHTAKTAEKLVIFVLLFEQYLKSDTLCVAIATKFQRMAKFLGNFCKKGQFQTKKLSVGQRSEFDWPAWTWGTFFAIIRNSQSCRFH